MGLLGNNFLGSRMRRLSGDLPSAPKVGATGYPTHPQPALDSRALIIGGEP